MILSNCSKSDIEEALRKVNETETDGNLEFNNFQTLNSKGTRHRVTLRVKDSHGKGSKYGISYFMGYGKNPRHTISVSWKTHGLFFKALLEINDKAVIKTCQARYSKDENDPRDPSNWIDFNVGSLINPVYASSLETDE